MFSKILRIFAKRTKIPLSTQGFVSSEVPQGQGKSYQDQKRIVVIDCNIAARTKHEGNNGNLHHCQLPASQNDNCNVNAHVKSNVLVNLKISYRGCQWCSIHKQQQIFDKSWCFIAPSEKPFRPSVENICQKQAGLN